MCKCANIIDDYLQVAVYCWWRPREAFHNLAKWPRRRRRGLEQPEQTVFASSVLYFCTKSQCCEWSYPIKWYDITWYCDNMHPSQSINSLCGIGPGWGSTGIVYCTQTTLWSPSVPWQGVDESNGSPQHNSVLVILMSFWGNAIKVPILDAAPFDSLCMHSKWWSSSVHSAL